MKCSQSNTALMSAGLLMAVASISMAREWTDDSGKYSVVADYVTSDEMRVVLANGDEELIVVDRKQLSADDQQYIAEQELTKSRATDKPKDETPGSQKTKPSAVEQKETIRESRQPTTDSTWTLRDGEFIKGWLIGYASEQLAIGRERGEIIVNDRPIGELPSAYRKIVPEVVAKADNVQLVDLAELESHLADRGGGPFKYQVVGIRLSLKSEGTITIPISLLEKSHARVVAPGFARWQAAQDTEVSDDDRSETASLENLLLDGYQRRRSQRRPHPKSMRYLELSLLAAEAGATDIWEVAVYPPRRYAFPRSVVVTAPNSLAAQQMVKRKYPGFRIGAARSATY